MSNPMCFSCFGSPAVSEQCSGCTVRSGCLREAQRLHPDVYLRDRPQYPPREQIHRGATFAVEGKS
jgi:hypothetical protein